MISPKPTRRRQNASKAAQAREEKLPKKSPDSMKKHFGTTKKKLNILPAHYFPRATAHIPQMIKMIETLIEKGHAYEKNGNVFYDVTSFKDYGKLSGNTLDNLKVGARLEEHPDKKHPWDFALWLKAPANHILQWDSPWSRGYPGWHIECSAMSIGISRRYARYPHRRRRPYFPPSRSRNRPIRRRHRQKILKFLDPQPLSAGRRRKNVQIQRKFLYFARYHRQRLRPDASCGYFIFPRTIANKPTFPGRHSNKPKRILNESRNG